MDKTNGKTTDEFVNMFSFLTKVVRAPTPTLAGFLPGKNMAVNSKSKCKLAKLL